MADDKVPPPHQPSNSTFASVGIGVPVAIVVAWASREFLKVDMPGEVQAALGAIISASIGYFFSGGRRADTE